MNMKDPISGVLCDKQRSTAVINNYFVKVGEELDLALPRGPGLGTLPSVGTTYMQEPSVTVEKLLEFVVKIDVSKHSSLCGFINGSCVLFLIYLFF